MTPTSFGTLRHSARPRWSAFTVLALSVSAWACRDTQSPTAVRDLASTAAARSAVAGRGIPDEYIVVFAPDVADVPGLARQLVAQSQGELHYTYTAALKGFSAHLPSSAIEGLRRNPRVTLVEPDEIASVDDVQPTPPSWGLDRVDQRALPLDNSYTYTADGAGVSVYVFDTGIRTTHVDFGGRASGVFTSIADGNGTNDCHGHGTHVAGTIGGASYGIAKRANLYAVRVLNCSGSGSYSGIIAGVDWVVANGGRPAVANMSIGGPVSASLTTAIQNAVSDGVTFAVSAGNSSTDACTQGPSNVDVAITVGATGSNDSRASYSNYGTCVDIFAPGSSIVSDLNTSDVATGTKSGTSMSSPHVAGAAALYLSTNPAATPAQVASALTANATPGVVSSPGVGSPNLLLFTGGSATPPPPPPGGDQPPTASFNSSCPKGICTFDASGSTDDKGIVSYSWNFGDGSTGVVGSSARVTYAYSVAATYTVTLTVTDALGQTAQATAKVKIPKIH